MWGIPSSELQDCNWVQNERRASIWYYLYTRQILRCCRDKHCQGKPGLFWELLFPRASLGLPTDVGAWRSLPSRDILGPGPSCHCCSNRNSLLICSASSAFTMCHPAAPRDCTGCWISSVLNVLSTEFMLLMQTTFKRGFQFPIILSCHFLKYGIRLYFLGKRNIKTNLYFFLFWSGRKTISR